jgi:hypothetical protein
MGWLVSMLINFQEKIRESYRISQCKLREYLSALLRRGKGLLQDFVVTSYTRKV